MKTQPFKMKGRVLSETTEKGIPGLVVEAWDSSNLIDDRLVQATTGDDGEFSIEFDPAAVPDVFPASGPEIYFKVFRGKELIVNTVGSVISTPKNRMEGLTIKIKPDVAICGDGPRNIFSDKNETIRIDTFEKLDDTNTTAVMSFFKRIGATHFFWEQLKPIMEMGEGRIFAAVKDRPWPPWGLGAQKIYALCLVHGIGASGVGITPVFTSPADRTNIGLMASVYKETLESLINEQNASVNYLVVEGSVLAAQVLIANGFTKSQDEIFLTETARYNVFGAHPAEIAEKLGLCTTSSLDLLRHSIEPQMLERNAIFHAVFELATHESLTNPRDIWFDPEILITIDGGRGGLFQPGGVPPGVMS